MTTDAELEASAAVVQAVLEESLPGLKTFGGISAQSGRVEVSVFIETGGHKAPPVNIMADAIPSTGLDAETTALAQSVADAATITGIMGGKFVYLRQFDVVRNADYALVSLHLTSDVRFV